MPSQFDAALGYALGHAAAGLVAAGATAYMATAHCLAAPTAEWRLCGLPLYSLMAADRRAGEAVAVVRILFNHTYESFLYILVWVLLLR